MAHLRITSLDVAARAGVSQSAVSRVFTPGASASAKTVAKVRRAAKELGYRPNAMARTMITGKSRIIGLIVAYLDNQFYPMALELLSNALQAQGYHILVFTASNAQDRVAEIVSDLMEYQVDGIITASVAMSNDLTARCAAAGIPVVMFNRGQDGVDLSSVTSANQTGGRKVADFLIAQGYSRIAHISGWQGSSTGQDRLRGFCACLENHNASPVAVVDGMYRRDVAAGHAVELMKTHRPDAIFVGNDHMAFAVLDALRSTLGLSVPDDVAVVGFDDVPAASWAAYDLTTVRQPVNQMVQATVELLTAQIDDRAAPARRVEIDGPLVVRGTAPEQLKEAS